jgi:hypothetical protein
MIKIPAFAKRLRCAGVMTTFISLEYASEIDSYAPESLYKWLSGADTG